MNWAGAARTPRFGTTARFGVVQTKDFASAAPPTCAAELNKPSVWRFNRAHAAAKVDALASNGMDEIGIPAFLRKQAD